ncbi:cache domain-containing protein [Caenispirillum bisanense]|uniref:Methyl-accepting chemotaxis protein n=1 Tax=Caenispirillum bisanense TaxID=414052 RepID=A0A286G5F6_9PROT|nr:cache domain-containing protein [Caenispirillum bisanense]SOD90733.1 methyl-accepting chemotaxis protein [Caenispirillum bisanense]
MTFSILGRIGAAMVAVAALAAAVASVPALMTTNDIISTTLQRQLDQAYEKMAAAIAAESSRAASMSAVVAALPPAREAFAAGDRDRLTALFADGFAALKSDWAVEQFQFHTPPATSFLRLHKPEKFGDDLSGFRATVVQANRGRQTVTGLESGVAGLGVRGVVPVPGPDGAHVGTVEVGTSFGPAFFQHFSDLTGLQVALHVRKADGAGFETFASTLTGASVFTQNDLMAALGGSPVMRRAVVSGVDVGVYAHAVTDFSGAPIAVAEIVMDATPYTEQLSAARTTTLLAGLAAVVLASVLGFLIARGIARPVGRMTAVMDAIGHRQFEVDIPAQDRRDEIGAMARALVTLRDRAREVAENEAAQGRRLAEVEAREAEVRRETEAHLVGVVDAAIQSNEAIIVLAHMMEDVAAASRQSQAMASAIEELVASVHEISRNSETAADGARDAEGAAGDGLSAAGHATSTMEQIFRAVSDAAANVTGLAEASAQIGTIIEEIEDIADQTNLLALNATIEAARAGDAGKGFAVVANEVKNLAGQTGRATEDIRARIENLRQEMTTIVTAMENGAAAVEKGRTAVHALGDRLQDIAGAVNGVNGKIAEIAAILSQQTMAASEVSRGTASIADLSRRNDEEIGEVLRAMDRASAVLNERVGEFAKVGTGLAIVQVAKNDHVVFKKRIIDALIGRGRWAPSEVPDHHACRLGKWYDGVQDPAIRDQAAFKRMEQPHARVHAAGVAALKAAQAGDRQAALKHVEEMNDASHAVLDLLDELAKALSAKAQGAA